MDSTQQTTSNETTIPAIDLTTGKAITHTIIETKSQGVCGLCHKNIFGMHFSPRVSCHCPETYAALQNKKTNKETTPSNYDYDLYYC
jgi:hypothetical protein